MDCREESRGEVMRVSLAEDVDEVKEWMDGFVSKSE